MVVSRLWLCLFFFFPFRRCVSLWRWPMQLTELQVLQQHRTLVVSPEVFMQGVHNPTDASPNRTVPPAEVRAAGRVVTPLPRGSGAQRRLPLDQPRFDATQERETMNSARPLTTQTHAKRKAQESPSSVIDGM